MKPWDELDEPTREKDREPMRDMARILAAAGLRAEPIAGAGRGSASTVRPGLLDDAEPRVAVESVSPPVRIPASSFGRIAPRPSRIGEPRGRGPDGGADRLPFEEPGVETLREALRLVVAHRPGAAEEDIDPRRDQGGHEGRL